MSQYLTVLSPTDVRRVRGLASKLGNTGAAAKLSVHHTVVLRIISGLDIRKGSAALVKCALVAMGAGE